MKIPDNFQHGWNTVMRGEYDIPLNIANPVILDIGACVGAFSVWAAQRWTGARIHCYEPMPDNFACLKENAPIAGLNNVAVTTAPTATMFPGLNNCGECSMFDLGEQRPDAGVPVAVLHPNRLPTAHIVKIDTEGCELEILNALTFKPAAIMLEYHRESDRLEIHKLLLNRGYTCVGLSIRCENRGVMKFLLNPPAQIAEPSAPIPANELSKRCKLFIATPAYQSMSLDCAESVEALLRLLDALRIPFFRSPTPGAEMVARARNRSDADFLATDCTNTIQIDGDIGFDAESVVHMAAANLHVVGGVYPFKCYNWELIRQAALAGVTADDLPAAGLNYVITPLGKESALFRSAVECAEIGTGFLMRSRTGVERMQAAYPDLEYDDDFPVTRGRKTFALFDYGVHQRRYHSEDWLYCQRWRAIGGRVWAWYMADLRHTGQHTFHGHFAGKIAVKPSTKETT